jgi:hypothetical protein
MSKLETNTIDTISGSTTLTLGGTNATTIAQDSATTVTGFKSTGIDDNATSTAITIDSNEVVNIKNTGSTADFVSETATSFIVGDGSGSHAMTLYSGTANNGALYFADGSTGNATYSGGVQYLHGSDAMRFSVNVSERMRIDTSGNVRINTTAASQEVNERLTVNGLGTFDEDDDLPLCVNRRNGDGGLVSFRQDGTQEGTITVSGSTVSYNGFTGTHWSRFQDNSTPTILKGTVLESLDEMCDWYNLEFDVTTTTQDEDGNDVETVRTKKIPHVLLDSQSNGDTVTYNYEGTDYQATIVKENDVKHMMSKVSDTADAKNVYGVFVAYDEDGEGYNDFYVASVGSFVVRIKANETIAKGDLLQSNGDGTAKVQTDDNVKSSSFAKVLSTTVIETYDDGSFIVPCSLMC